MKLVINQGKYKNRNYQGKQIVGTKPLRQNIKKTIFDVLGYDLSGKYVLDLFSGYGTFNMEALSLNAKFVQFNDLNRACINVIYRWLTNLNISKNQFWVTNYDVRQMIKFNKYKNIYDIVFFDPPFPQKEAQILLKKFITQKLFFHNESIIIYRTFKDNTLLPDIANHVYKVKVIGKNQIYFLNLLK